jgi:ferric-dicitrate binding protein FerR (iron transport regulator)
MNIPNHILMLITKELEGNLTSEERLLLNQWYEGLEAENGKLLDTRKKANLKRLRSKIKSGQSRKIDFRWIGWVAASAIILLGLFEIYNRDNLVLPDHQINEKKAYEEFVNPKGVRRQLSLPDGSKILLNSGSKIRVSKGFTTNRKVLLEGEAFFEVAKDAENPFIVITDNLETKVLGTAFTVRAYKGKPQIVSVKEGKVNVREASGQRPDENNFLIANEQLTYKEDFGLGTKIKFNPVTQFAWVEGKIIFEQTPINEVFDTLSDWYGLESVQLSDQNMKCQVTGIYTRMTLEDIMESIKYATGIAYEINGKHLKIKKGNC